jgi:cytoskeletal protein RodZ
MASFGENLRRERELRGVDLRDIAEATNISLRFLQALEQDRADVLPGGIFPKAFVRQYASYLGLDPDRLVAEYVYTHGGEVSGGGAAPRPPASGRMAAVFFRSGYRPSRK